MLICAELAPYIETRFGVKPQEQNREGHWAKTDNISIDWAGLLQNFIFY